MVALSVLLGFILLIIIDYFVLKAEKKLHPAFVKNYKVIDNVSFKNLSVTIPADIFVSRGHTWAELQKNGSLKIGLDEFIKKSLGDFIITKTATPGAYIKKGDPILTANLGDKKIQFRSPVEGKILSRNSDLIGRKFSDPFGEDWGLIVMPDNVQQATEKLRINEEVIEWMKSELRRFRNYLDERLNSPSLAGVTMFDGGHIVPGVVSQLDNESVDKFQQEFLSI